MLPDVLTEGLRIVFCGTAVGIVSAQRQSYYAGPGNKFWKVLFETGLTNRLFHPSEYQMLPELGIGLTDLVKLRSGIDAELNDTDFDIESFNERIKRYRPGIVCFNGKKASKSYFEASGAANAYWDIAYWKQVARIANTSA